MADEVELVQHCTVSHFLHISKKNMISAYVSNQTYQILIFEKIKENTWSFNDLFLILKYINHVAIVTLCLNCSSNINDIFENLLPHSLNDSQSMLRRLNDELSGKSDPDKPWEYVIFLVVFSTGFIGNIVVIGLITNCIKDCFKNFGGKPKQSSLYVLLNLAIADLFFVMIYLPYEANNHASFIDDGYWQFNLFSCRFIPYLGRVMHCSSCWLTALLSIQRLLASFPRFKKSTHNFTVVFILVIWVISFLIPLPTLVRFGNQEPQFNLRSRTNMTVVIQENISNIFSFVYHCCVGDNVNGTLNGIIDCEEMYSKDHIYFNVNELSGIYQNFSVLNDELTNHEEKYTCWPNKLPWFEWYLLILTLFLPFIIITTSYTMIICKLKTQQRRMNKHKKTSKTFKKMTSTGLAAVRTSLENEPCPCNPLLESRKKSSDSRMTRFSMLSRATTLTSYQSNNLNMDVLNRYSHTGIVNSTTQDSDDFSKKIPVSKVQRKESNLVKKIVFLTGRLIIAYIICWAPSTVSITKKYLGKIQNNLFFLFDICMILELLVLSNMFSYSTDVTHRINTAFKVLAFCNASINPVIYALSLEQTKNKLNRKISNMRASFQRPLRWKNTVKHPKENITI